MDKLKSYLKNRLTRLYYEKDQAMNDNNLVELSKLKERVDELNNLAANFNIKLKKL